MSGILLTLLLVNASDEPNSQPTPIQATFTYDSTGSKKESTISELLFVPLSDQKPAGITKEPMYRARPRYSIIRVGNGPLSSYSIALDEPDGKDFAIYVDVNRNGDLSDDGDGSYDTMENGPEALYGDGAKHVKIHRKSYLLRESLGTSEKEIASRQCGLEFRRVLDNREGRIHEAFRSYLRIDNLSANVGTIAFRGKAHKALFSTETISSIYPRMVRSFEMPTETPTAVSPPHSLLRVDLNDNSSFIPNKNDEPEEFLLVNTIQIAGKNYEANYTADGSKLALTPTTKLPRNALLPAGELAPEFRVETSDGESMKLSDLRGKVVILDFWGVWCQPCLQALPHLEEIYQDVKAQGVELIAINTADPKDTYLAWLRSNKQKYHFFFGYDDENDNESIAYDLFQVKAMPTTYIVGKDGRIVDAIVGYSDGDVRIDAALNRLGIKTKIKKTSKK